MADHPQLKKIKLKRWELRKDVLEIIILGILSGGGSWTRPTLPLLIKAVIEGLKEDKKLNIEEKKIRRILKNFEERDILSISENKDSVSVYTLNKKNPVVTKYSIRLLIDFKKNKKDWRGRWYLVFFDVPEIQRNKRDYLRRYLTKLGFYPYQKSVYLLPYECEKEIALIKKVVEGAKYMKYIVAEKIEDESEAKIFFQLV